MINLLIDTSTEHGTIAFFSKEKVLLKGTIPRGLHNSKYLTIEIEKGLKQLGIKTSDLKYIAVAIGPGSYTGIRVGVIVAKALAYASRLPIITLCSLDGYVPDSDGKFISIIDAKIGGCYFRIGKKEGKHVEWLTEPAIKELEKLEEIQTIQTLVTPNGLLLEKKLQLLNPELTLDWQEKAPSVENLIREAEKKFTVGEVEKNTEFQLLYLRKTQAEIEKS